MPRIGRFLALAQNGKLHFDQPGTVSGFIAALDGKRIEVTIQRLRVKRSLPQNKKLWASYREGIRGMEEYTGHTEKELHEFLKEEYCPPTEVVVFGQKRMIKSTALLDREQFSAYLERCLAFFASHGIDVSGEGMEITR